MADIPSEVYEAAARAYANALAEVRTIGGNWLAYQPPLRAAVESAYAAARFEVLKGTAQTLLAEAEAFDEKWCRHRSAPDDWDKGYVAGLTRAAWDVANSANSAISESD